jgi:hypothetical protein
MSTHTSLARTMQLIQPFLEAALSVWFFFIFLSAARSFSGGSNLKLLASWTWGQCTSGIFTHRGWAFKLYECDSPSPAFGLSPSIPFIF